MRNEFAKVLHAEMAKNENIVLVVADLGYFIFDKIREDYPDRFYNVQAAEFGGLGFCIGLSLMGKIPFFYSITPFLIHRPFELIKLYLEHEQIPVILVGSGRGKDYLKDGISHWEDETVTERLNVWTYYPDKTNMEEIVKIAIELKQPTFISLLR